MEPESPLLDTAVAALAPLYHCAGNKVELGCKSFSVHTTSLYTYKYIHYSNQLLER